MLLVPPGTMVGGHLVGFSLNNKEGLLPLCAIALAFCLEVDSHVIQNSKSDINL